MAETGEFSGEESSPVELVESDEESGAQSSSSSATASSLLNRLRSPKSLVSCPDPALSRGKKGSGDLQPIPRLH